MSKSSSDNEQSKPKHVKELEHFPFKNFEELKQRTTEGVANIGVDRGVALQWSQNGIYSSQWQRTQSLFLAFMPFIAAAGFLIYAIATQNWLLLLTLPVLFVGFFILHPSSAMVFGFIRSGLIGLIFLGLIWGIIDEVQWLVAITLSLAIIWYAQRTIYRKAVGGIICAALNHEDMLCLLWSGNALNITMYNGDNYWSQWKTEGGKTTHYESGNTYD